LKIKGVNIKVDFDVIEIMDDSNPYPALLCIDSSLDNNEMLNMKKRKTSFETDTSRVISLLDMNEGDNYNEAINEDAQRSITKNIYHITWNIEEYINTTIDGELSCIRVCMYDME
jgi:hypothetical protein